MEVELEPRVKPLPYKVKAMSRESPSQKAAHVLDNDLRSHWSTATNTKEWILLELDEPCLLSHIRIYNKSVLEWEIAVGLRYKPETFLKVRPRCEAPRRDMIYPTNYTPCRYVKISCLRGNPIAIFFVQLMGASVAGLEPEFQPVVNYLLPHIISHKQDPHDMHLQLLQDITNRLLMFLPQLEADLTNFLDTPESNIRFLAMLAGPFYPILQVVNERTTSRPPGSSIADFSISKSNQLSPALTVSTNFEPRRSRGASPFILSAYSAIVFRADAIFVLLRKAYKDSDLGSVCRMVSRIMQKLIGPDTGQDASNSHSEVTSVLDETSNIETSRSFSLLDYSNLFGEEFQMPDQSWDYSYLNILDVGAVEEGMLHILYACASQPVLCGKLAEKTSDFWAVLPLVQALLPALRPCVSSPFDIVDDTFSPWKQPIVQHALSQIVATTMSEAYRSLLHACAGYLSSFSPSHARAACVLIDLCSGVLAPWMSQVIAKVDLALELLEDLLGVIQDVCHSLVHARAALKYIVLALSGHMDDILGKYKEVKHKILFLVEMLEPFLDPAIAASKSRIAFGDLSSVFPEKQENNCLIALNIIRTAVRKPAVLPSLESEWRHGSVAPSVLLSILEPHMLLPPDIDLCKSASKPVELETPSVSPLSPFLNHGGASSKSNSQDESDGKIDVSESAGKLDYIEDRNLLFAPPELQSITLTNFSNVPNQNTSNLVGISVESKHVMKQFTNQSPTNFVLDAGLGAEYFNLQADYLQLANYHECELRASEFRRLALDLHAQNDVTVESHDAAIDALLLAAECYVNPYFMLSFGASQKLMDLLNINDNKISQSHDIVELKRTFGKNKTTLETIAHLERKRDKLVLQILLEAAETDRKYHARLSNGEDCPYSAEGVDDQVIKLSPLDVQLADAITLVRQNQALLCNFLIQRLYREQNSMHEILMQSLVYVLHTATKLYCPPELIIDVILRSAEELNMMLMSLHHQLKEGSLNLAPERIHGVQRRWVLLQRLVVATSSGDEEAEFGPNIHNKYRCGNLIPSSAWMQRIPQFSGSVYPLVRFLGWMAVSRNAKQYMKDQNFLASDLSQLTYLLSVFADDLAVVDNVVNQKYEEVTEDSQGEIGSSAKKGLEHCNQYHEDQSFPVIYPELWKFFPNMKKQFETFGEAILEAVGLQLRSVSSTLVPDVMYWFSELCSWPFSFASPSGSDILKGYNAKNARAIILYILEAIIAEHMEAMVPEIPRVVQVLVSLSSSAYCDVSFLDSVLRLLKPIISYSLSKVSRDESLLVNDSCLNFEELCFSVLFDKIKQKNENQHSSEDKRYNIALSIFILASVFPDLSIHHKRDFLQSLSNWVKFYAFEPTTSFYDYLSAFQCVMDSCKLLLVHMLRAFGASPLQLPPFLCMTGDELSDDNLEPTLGFLSDVFHTSFENDAEKVEIESVNWNALLDQYNLSSDDLEGISKDIEGLITELNIAIEHCWNLHHQLTRKLTIASAECFVFSKCLILVTQKFNNADDDDQNSSPYKSVDQVTLHWRIGLEGLAEMILMLQETSCWKVSCLMLDCLLGVPHSFPLDNVIGMICSAIKNVSCSAPKISWRLQTDKWLSSLITRGIYSIRESEVPLLDLFCTLLGHAEPEQRVIAIKHLRKLIGQSGNGERALLSSKICNDSVPTKLIVSVPDFALSHLVSSTWDEVVVLASSESSLQIRLQAMTLLLDYIPFAERHQLQSLLAAADSICCLRNLQQSHDGPILQLSLALIAGACLYSPAEDISLIPQNIWRDVEALGSIEHDCKLGDIEKRACQVLCRLRDEGDEAKEVLKEVIFSSSSKQYDPNFANTRESILQVLANLTAVHSYFDLFSKKIDQNDIELEEAEMELDIIRKEYGQLEPLEDSKDRNQIQVSGRENSRLQQIRDSILSLEKSKLREDIVARRQKKLVLRHARQKFMDEAALREAELLQELDRERATEMEKELERQQLLELERAKTRELRHNLDMEKERQTQRELQRELEQVESGQRPSRRDYSSSTHSSRPRERFRERENGRSGNEGSTRAAGGSLQSEMPATMSSSMAASPTIVLSGSRQYSGQLPTILQSRDRQDDSGSMYEENFDGSKDSGDTSSIGDPELVSAFDGQSSGYGSQRHTSRGSKSRQAGERRDRDNRREGKWERKHS